MEKKLLDPDPVIERFSLFDSLYLMLKTLKWLIVTLNTPTSAVIPLQPSFYLIDGKDLETVRMTITGPERIFSLATIKLDWLAVMQKQIDGRHTVEHKGVRTDLEPG